jgi:serine/threonine protein kinase
MQYGKVYRGLWNHQEVAIKSVILPSSMNSKEKHQRTAIMEVAISSSLSHPNILQTYTYSLKPVTSPAAEAVNGRGRPSSGGSVAPLFSTDRSGIGSPSPPTGFEIQLVLEYCNAGALRDVLDYRAFQMPDGKLNYAAVLDTAIDIARGMQHLHKVNVVHSDLKVRHPCSFFS